MSVAVRSETGRILKPGRNCWRVAHAGRVAFLVDAAAYFAAVREAMARARRSILIVAWDIDSRTPLVNEQPPDGLPTRLGPLLRALIARRPALEVHVLDWDFAMVYATDRELLPLYSKGWEIRGRLHFHLDDRHPPGASQHQKLVVIDDTVAFAGGMDLAQARWDTPEHPPASPFRVRSNGDRYPPVHDVQMLVDGAAAGAIGELARDRWHRATGHAIRRAELPDEDVWPPTVGPDITDVDVAVARTLPRYDGQAEVNEVRQLYLDSIAAAEREIYIENQYLTASCLGNALESRLRQPNCPEIVVVSRLSGGGWLEENTMAVLRARMLHRLRTADRGRRFHIYYPDCAGYENECINVHSKLMIMDDRLLRIGSANFANRSMGLDAECDLAIEATEPRVRAAIVRFRNRLVAEHLGVKPETVERTVSRTGSLSGAIDELRGGWRWLQPLRGEVPEAADARLPAASVIDPEAPIDPDSLMDELVPVEHHPEARRRLLLAAGVLACAALLAAAWHWGPLADWLSKDNLIAMGECIETMPGAPVWVFGAYVLAALTAVPITLVIFVTALVFGPGAGFCYAFAGSLLGAGATFGVGHSVGRNLVRRVAGKRITTLNRWLKRQGLLAVLTVRLVPVAPFTVVNLVAGASHIRFLDFILGTALGMLPGIAAITLFSGRIAAVLARPTPINVLLLLLAAAVIAAGVLSLHRWLRGHESV